MTITFGPERKRHGYRILPRAEIVARSNAGEEKTLPMAGLVLDAGGAYKIGTYFVRELSKK